MTGSPGGVYDFAVIGAGIVGLAVARELRARHGGASIVVIDREDGPATHQTGHNSGVIHSGVYYQPGSLKARLCVEGARRMYEFCEERGIAYERCGKLIVALREDELPGLEELHRRGTANGVPGLRRVAADEIGAIEPGCRGIAALHCPSTGIIDFRQVALAMERDLLAGGVEFMYRQRVLRLTRRGKHTEVDCAGVDCAGASISAGFVVACAGLWSDRLAAASGAPRDPRIVPMRGGYLTLRKTATPLVNGLVYPVPDPSLPFLGVHVTKHVDGAVTLGPTALLVGARNGYRLGTLNVRDIVDTLTWPGTWRMARRYWRTGIDEIAMAVGRGRFVRAAAGYVPAVRDAGVEAGSTAGIRAQALSRDGTLVDDFVLSQTPGAVHVRNAPSPAATSTLALASLIADKAG